MFPESSIQEDAPESISPTAIGAAPASRQEAFSRGKSKRRVSARKLIFVTLLIVGAVAGYMAFSGNKSPRPYPATTLLPGQAPEADEPAGAVRTATAASAPAAPVTTLATVASAVSAVLERANTAVTDMRDMLTQQAEINRKIDQLTQEVATVVASIKEREAKDAQRQAALAAARPVVTARSAGKAKVAAAAASTPQTQAKLLAVDIWDDQPSVALGTTTDRRVKFMNPSDSVGAVSIVAANPSAQTATLQVGDRSIVLHRDQ